MTTTPAPDDLLDDAPSYVDLWQPVPEEQMVRTCHLAFAVDNPQPGMVALRYVDEHGGCGGVTFDPLAATNLSIVLSRVAGHALAEEPSATTEPTGSAERS